MKRISRTRAGIATTITWIAGAMLLTWTTTAISGSGPNIESLSPESRMVISETVRELRTSCLDDLRAEQLLRSKLADIDAAPDFVVRTDGPIAHPIGEAEAVRAHLAHGCTAYAGTGFDAEGRRVFYISGLDAFEAWDRATDR